MNRETIIYQLQKRLIDKLWKDFLPKVAEAEWAKVLGRLIPDHFALIDIPSKNSGINHLKAIFNIIGYVQAGTGYLAEKANDFIWMRETNSANKPAYHALPQAVLADFRLDDISTTNRKIINKYFDLKHEFDFKANCHLAEQSLVGDIEAADQLIENLYAELTFTPWKKPTVKDYLSIKEENQLIAWAILFGRKINHFGLSTHLNQEFDSIKAFNDYLSSRRLYYPNQTVGKINGGKHLGIAQFSLDGKLVKVECQDGFVEAHDSFVEFVWRYPLTENPIMTQDYFNDFVPPNANKIIEAVFTKNSV